MSHIEDFFQIEINSCFSLQVPRDRFKAIKRQGHGLGGGGGPFNSRQVPGDLYGDHGFPQFQGDGRLGDGTVAPMHRDEGVGAVGNEHVPGMPQVGGDGIGKVGVGPAPVPVGQDPPADAVALHEPVRLFPLLAGGDGDVVLPAPPAGTEGIGD